MTFVLDCSITIAAVLPDGAVPEAIALFTRAAAEGAHAPAIWPLEVTNALLTAQRRKRIDPAFVRATLADLRDIAVMIDEGGAAHAFADTFDIAERHGLTSCDAAYLELARRLGLPLATLDQKLASAAHDSGIPLT